jgi:hypothetical protein
MSIRQTLLRWIGRYRKQNSRSRFDAGRQSLPTNPSVEPTDGSWDGPDTGTSPGIVEAATEELDMSGALRSEREEEAVGDWETAIANSMSRTFELVI